MWNQSGIGGVVTPASVRKRRSPGQPVGEGGQHRTVSPADGIEVAADQRFDVRAGFGDGAEDLAATRLRFDIADPHLQMPLAALAAADEGRIQGHHDRRRQRGRPDRSALTQSLADLQGMAAQGRMMRSRVDRENICSKTSAAVL